jgi:hypothetical protein
LTASEGYLPLAWSEGADHVFDIRSDLWLIQIGAASRK